jgi:tetratricopeptide (TPR) repeat protein
MNDQRSVLDNERSRRAVRAAWSAALCVVAIAAHAGAQPAPVPAPQQPAPVQSAPATPAPAAPAPTTAPNAAAPASAPAEPTQQQRDTAREAYGRGQALFAQGNYAEAKAAFDQAYAAVPNPVVLLSTAECQVRLNQLDDAYVTLQKYLSDRPGAPDRADVEQKAAELLATPGHVVVATEPAGAAISIDGQVTGKVSPAEFDLKRGEHTIGLSLAGYDAVDEKISARIGARHEIQIALRAAPAVVAEPPPPELKTATSAEKPTTALWITGIVGAAGLVTGTVLGFMVLAERSDYDAHPTKASADRGERLALFTDVAFGVGAMALVTSAVLYLTSGEPGAPTAPQQNADHARIQLMPVATAHGGGLAAGGRF